MTAGHKGLGKGLGSLFGEELTETQGTVSQVELRQIEPNPAQPRRDFAEEALAQLAESIRENGLISPITERKTDTGYQILQSLYAIGSGGLMGLGLGKGRQKYLYLPEEHNDYIFPIVCEELGFIGAMVVILLFVLLILRGYWIAMHARDRFGALMTAGLTTHLALQVFLNIGVVTNFLPATGISLPFFSYGGTALLIQLFEMGLILAVSRQNDNKLL